MASGDEATSMPAITSAAELNLASVNYHFGSKEGLLREVFRRRLAWLNKQRIAARDALAGADIQEFDKLDTPGTGLELVARGWHLLNRLAAISYPTLALARLHWLGGGLELALACRYLLAVDEPGTKMGQPKVMLGIFPGWGGMLRLPQRVGPQAALDMMLTGKIIDAQRAKRMGLADECVPPRVSRSPSVRVWSTIRRPARSLNSGPGITAMHWPRLI